MSAETTAAPGMRPVPPDAWELLGVACGLMALAVLLQSLAGAYGAEFDYDESSHYVSGLLIHDYAASGFRMSALAFLARFHASYPLVGIGHWGPFHYAIEAAWMLVFGCSRTAVLLLSACVSGTVALTLYRVAVPRFGRILAMFTAAGYIGAPLVQQGTAAVMLDGAVTLCCLIAALAFRSYLDTGRARYSVLFGLSAAAGLLTKGNAGCLALLPVFTLVLTRNWRIMRQPSFWLPVPIVGAITVPWYVFTYGQVAAGFRYRWGWDYVALAVPANLGILLWALGPFVFSLGLAGLAMVCFGNERHRADSLIVTMAALLCATFVFQSAVPAAIQNRYLAPALPPLLLLAACAVHRGLRGTRREHRPRVRLALLVLPSIAALPWVVEVTPKRTFGMVQAAREVWALRQPNDPAVLIVADGAAEGAAVAELAMDDPARPSLLAVRGSRLLGGGGYNSQDYIPRFATADQVMAAIDSYAIPLVLLRNAPGDHQWAHIDQVERAHRAAPQRWKLLYEDRAGGATTRLYQIDGKTASAADVGRLMDLSAPQALRGTR